MDSRDGSQKMTRSVEVCHEEKMMIYAKNRFLNKIVYGSDRKLMESENINLQVEISASLDDCFLVVTGVKRKLFGLEPDGQYKYFDNSPLMSESVYQILEQCGYQGDYTYMDPTQEICILFSVKRSNRVRPEQVVERIQDRLHCILREKLPEERMCCYTVFGGYVGSYENVTETFRRATALHDLSFFDMRPMVMTEEVLADIQKPFSFNEASEILKSLEHMLENADAGEELLRELFLVRLKNSYNFILFDDVLAEMKRMLWEIYRVYDMEEDFPQEAFERSNYARLEEVYDQIVTMWRRCHRQIHESRRCMSYITRNAVLYMKNHYTEDITARDVSDFVHVSVSHLSHIFNKEMNQSIPAFLVSCRIEESKRLLRETSMRVADVSASIGISNVSYFLKIFKQYEGVTPQEFRYGGSTHV
jgi:YesN/AraC family two-component response regulator